MKLSSPRSRLPALLLLSLLTLACEESAPLLETEFQCGDATPCGPGFSCDPTGRCVPASDSDLTPDGGLLPDGLLPDGLLADAELPDAELPDAELPDAELPDAELPDADPADAADAADAEPPACEVDAAVGEEGPYTFADYVIRTERRVGGPTGQFVALNLDNDPGGTVELAVVRGGRVELLGADGRLWWRSPVLDVRRVADVVDLDGDGRREVIAQSGRSVHVFDGLTGQLHWSLSDAPFGPDGPTLVAVKTVLVGDINQDERPELYMTDGSCSTGGTGYGVFQDFSAGVDASTTLSTIQGPRANGRCTRWHSLADLDGNGRRELVISDSRGLQGFDPLTGDNIFCGALADSPPSGELPYLTVRLGAAAAESLFVLDRNRVMRVGLTEQAVEGCPNGLHLVAQWTTSVGGPLRVEGSAALDVDGDGILDVVTSAFDEGAQAWRLVALSGDDGALLASVLDVLLEGAVDLDQDGSPELVIRRGEARQPTRFGTVDLVELLPDGALISLWPTPFDGVAAVDPILSARFAGGTEELAPLATLRLPGVEGPDGRLVLLTEDPAADGAGLTGGVALVSRRGEAVTRPLEGEPGGLTVLCDPLGGCGAEAPRDLLAMAFFDGRVALLDAQLSLRNPDPASPSRPAARAPTGTANLVQATVEGRPEVFFLGAGGLLGQLDLTAADPLAWRKARASHPDGPLVARLQHGSNLLIFKDLRAPESLAAVRTDGGAVWRHDVDPALLRMAGGAALVSSPDGVAEVVARYDLILDGARFEGDPRCPPDLFSDPNPLAPDARCPTRPVYLRLVTGLDPASGACLWRTVIRPDYTCSGPSNQALSAVDSDGDGRAELYITETDAIRRIDPLTGRLTALSVLGRIDDTTTARGGGWLYATGGPVPLIRAGGNGPVDAFDQDLNLIWRAERPAGIGDEAWVKRVALPVGAQLWTSPARGAPLYRYGQDAQGTPPLLAQVGLREGRFIEPDGGTLADLKALAPLKDAVGPDQDGVMAVADDGWLYVADTEGALAFSRQFGAAIGLPLAVDVDEDGGQELLVPVSDGSVVLLDEPGPTPPPAVWDLPCPARATCSPDGDIDETIETTQLCGELLTVAGVDGYEARVLGQNGAILTDYEPVDGRLLHFSGLDLTPGARYSLEVRAYRNGQPSGSRSSDGVLVTNDNPPEVALDLDHQAFAPGEVVGITVVAEDDDRLAGWALDVLAEPSGQLIRRIDSGAVAQRSLEFHRGWDGLTQGKEALPGLYRVRVVVFDRARNRGEASALVTLCDGPCL